MIRKVIIKGFKRFTDVTFELPGHVVIAGPNNTGKTTLLQAIAAWSLAFNVWARRNDFGKHRGYFTKVPLTRQVFSAVPLRVFDLLWSERIYQNPIEISIQHASGWTVTMELIPDTAEQIYVRPKADTEPEVLRTGMTGTSTVYVPPMTGLSTDEPVLQPPKILQLLGLGKPGDVLRNLLVQAHENETAWRNLTEAIRRLFGYELLPPDSSGADILAEYQMKDGAPKLDIASAGSGFQQVLMLLTFLNTRAGAVLLLDEPDAHLHLILQDSIYSELRTVAQRLRSQLVVATHSEIIIDSVEPRELCVMLQTPRMLSDSAEKSNLMRSLSVLTNTDLLLATDAPGVLYTEGHTDVTILKEWARILDHPVSEYLTKKLFWKPTVWENRPGAKGIRAQDHYDALALVRVDLPGLIILDGDARPEIGSTELTGRGLQRLRWRRYEIESYLIHPRAIEEYVRSKLGDQAAGPAIEDMRAHFVRVFRAEFMADPVSPEPLVENYLRTTKARTDILPPILEAAGLHGVPYTGYHEIAALMRPDEIHPEVTQMLDGIKKALGL